MLQDPELCCFCLEFKVSMQARIDTVLPKRRMQASFSPPCGFLKSLSSLHFPFLYYQHYLRRLLKTFLSEEASFHIKCLSADS